MTTLKNFRDYMFNVDFFKYMEILVKHRNFILVFCFSAIFTSLALTYIFSEKYRATASVFYRPVERSLMRQKSTAAFGSPLPVPPFKIISQTLNDAVKSDAILAAVTQELHLDQEIPLHYESWYERWYKVSKKYVKRQLLDLWEILKFGKIYPETPEIKAIKGLRQSVDIESSKDSYIYLLVATDKYPARAASIVDTTAKHLIQWVKAQGSITASRKRELLAVQLEEKNNEVALYLADRESLLLQNGFFSVSDEISTGVALSYELDVERNRLVSQIEENRVRIIELGKNISQSKIGQIDPDDIKRMESEKLFAEVELQGLRAKNQSLESSIQEMRSQLTRLSRIQKKIDELELKIDVSSREYINLSDLYMDAKGEVTNDTAEVKIMHSAYVPDKPISPVKIYHVGLTSLLSLLFSTGLVYIFAFFNVRIFFHDYKPEHRQNNTEQKIATE